MFKQLDKITQPITEPNFDLITDLAFSFTVCTITPIFLHEFDGKLAFKSPFFGCLLSRNFHLQLVQINLKIDSYQCETSAEYSKRATYR